MDGNYIKNVKELAATPLRADALSVVEAGLAAIDTEKAVLNSLELDGDILRIQGENYDLKKFSRVKVVGFGKASVAAAAAVQKVLGQRVVAGAVVGLEQRPLGTIRTFAGTHPRPSADNVIAGKEISAIVENGGEDDLVIALVSGGGSALLCSSESECEQGTRLYDSFLATGKKISELNTVRKHLGVLKGGGLAKLAYPATVIGLIFSDVPGDDFADVASGPTYPDRSTVADALRIINENSLGSFDLVETPKDEKYFEKVRNFVLVSNKVAARAMVQKATDLGYDAQILSTELYDEVPVVAKKITSSVRTGVAIIAAGEPEIKIGSAAGQGGRNTHLALAVLSAGLPERSAFVSMASDGLDNGPSAGAIVDAKTAERASGLGLRAGEYLATFDSGSFFKSTGDLIITGPTGSNVSDLMVFMTSKS